MTSTLKKRINGVAGMAIFALSASLVAGYASAQTTPTTPSTSATTAPAAGQKGANFAAHKEKELARIANNLQVHQTLQSCVQAANDLPALKQCNETAKASLQH